MLRAIALVLLLGCSTAAQPPQNAAVPPGAVRYGPGREPAVLEKKAIDESSGLAVSRRDDARFWTHNDSGDEPRLFAFDADGKHVGTYEVPDATARDWEDMASFELDGDPFLLIGDVGDNMAMRIFCTLYLVKEPKKSHKDVKEVLQTIDFEYEGGPNNCEAIGFDPTTRQVLLVTKAYAPHTLVFALDWPAADVVATVKPLTARKIAAVKAIDLATGMDISPDGRRAVVCTYDATFEYVRGADEDWKAVFARPGRRIAVPARRQGEAICFGADGKTLYLTTEKRPAYFWKVPVQKP